MCKTERSRGRYVALDKKTEAEMERRVTLLGGSCSSWKLAELLSLLCRDASLNLCLSESLPLCLSTSLLCSSLKLAVHLKQNQNWRFVTGNMADLRPHNRAAAGLVCSSVSSPSPLLLVYSATWFCPWPLGACFQSLFVYSFVTTSSFYKMDNYST